MKTELSKIAQDLKQGTITDKEARTLLLGLLSVSESTLPTEKEVVDVILNDVWIRGIDLEDYRHEFEAPRSLIKKKLDELYSR